MPMTQVIESMTERGEVVDTLHWLSF